MSKVDDVLRAGEDRLRSKLKSVSLEQSSIDVFDLFSGCGGLSYGFHALEEPGNVRVVGAIDLDQHANSTYARNLGLQPLSLDVGAEDITGVVDALGRNSRDGALRVVLGGPPCQGFSAHRKKDPRRDERNSLVRRYAEIAVQLAPDVIVLENVPDLCAKKHAHHYAGYRDTLAAAGYFVSTAILNFAHFGTPQERFRTVSIASRLGYPMLPEPWLCRADFLTVRDAIGCLQPLPAGSRSTTDEMHRTSRHRPETVEILRSVPKNGGSRPKGVGPECLDRTLGFSDVYGRLAWGKPAITITSRCRTPSCGRFAHPSQNRGLTIREAALLQGFPSSWHFNGPFDDMFKQVGNAVPPTASLALTDAVLGVLGGVGTRADPYPDPSQSGIKSFSSVIAHAKSA